MGGADVNRHCEPHKYLDIVCMCGLFVRHKFKLKFNLTISSTFSREVSKKVLAQSHM